LRILFIADAFAAAGRRIIEERLPGIRRDREVDFVIANAENVADGVGITSRIARKLFEAGVDVITLGNHAYRQREVYPYLDQEQRILRPANYPETAPGHGTCVAEAADGTRVAVINLIGSLFLDAAVTPFAVAERLVDDAKAKAAIVVVASAWKATAVLGTHTHIQTNDASILPGGTAYITDAGMTGPHDSVIGVRTDLVLRRFMTQLPIRFEPAEGDVRIEGAIFECDAQGRATAIESFRLLDDR